MIRIYSVFTLLFFGLFSCVGGANKKMSVASQKKAIESIDDSLYVMIQRTMMEDDFSVDKGMYDEAIKRNKEFYTHFPNDPFTEQALDKIAALYQAINDDYQAMRWRDTLLLKFPNTENKVGLLELQMNYYDINNYTPQKIREYGEQLLSIENLPDEKRESIAFRLANIHLNFEQLIELQMEKAEELLTE